MPVMFITLDLCCCLLAG